MGIGLLIPEAMISKSTIDKLASVGEKEILTVSDLVQEIFEYLVPFQMAQGDSRPNIGIYITKAGLRSWWCVCVVPLSSLLMV
jgi:hypothetical protein